MARAGPGARERSPRPCVACLDRCPEPCLPLVRGKALESPRLSVGLSSACPLQSRGGPRWPCCAPKGRQGFDHERGRPSMVSSFAHGLPGLPLPPLAGAYPSLGPEGSSKRQRDGLTRGDTSRASRHRPPRQARPPRGARRSPAP